MTKTFTRTEVEALIAADEAAFAAGEFDITSSTAAAIEGSGVAANADFAEDLDVDYIGALNDGTIVAWGRDFGEDALREIVFIAPADQVVADD